MVVVWWYYYVLCHHLRTAHTHTHTHTHRILKLISPAEDLHPTGYIDNGRREFDVHRGPDMDDNLHRH